MTSSDARASISGVTAALTGAISKTDAIRKIA
jgi:hypothetical protein